MPPTRLWIDAHSPEEWQLKGFYSLNLSQDPTANLFFQMIAAKAAEKNPPTKIVRESRNCPSSLSEKKIGMPYALPGLNDDQIMTLKSWVKQGAPGPNSKTLEIENSIPLETKKQIHNWEELLNLKDLRHQLVSRYFYEHLFLAHIYFNNDPEKFFRIVRSKTKCNQKVIELATRRPNDPPEAEIFYYCIIRQPGTIVAKTHIPYEFNPAKKLRFENFFFKTDWKVSKLPAYGFSEAENPLRTFSEIPVKARYQFLLDNAHYHVATFIKGPVCNGSAAVNAIQEQFFVFFIDPSSDLMIRSPGFQEQSQQMLILPGVWGSDITLDSTPSFLRKLTEKREGFFRLSCAYRG